MSYTRVSVIHMRVLRPLHTCVITAHEVIVTCEGPPLMDTCAREYPHEHVYYARGPGASARGACIQANIYPAVTAHVIRKRNTLVRAVVLGLITIIIHPLQRMDLL